MPARPLARRDFDVRRRVFPTPPGAVRRPTRAAVSDVTPATLVARAPGRVNLIGDHTDYTGGLVLPMAIDRWTEIHFTPRPGWIDLRSDDEPDPVSVALPVHDVRRLEPRWGRYVAAVAAEMGADAMGIAGSVSTDIPIGAGWSSSAALEIAAALAFGHPGSPLEVAQLCRRAEFAASGVPCGIMDQLVIAAAVDAHALMIDCTSYEAAPVALPVGVDIVIRFVAHRTLEGSEYGDRVAECNRAQAVVGSLATAQLADLRRIDDPLVRRRARHVISENQRVRDFAAALAADDIAAAGRLMLESHRSLAEDFGTSTPVMDAAVAEMAARPGVWGVRMTGGGFGGCIVALAESGAVGAADGWVVRPVGGARVVNAD